MNKNYGFSGFQLLTIVLVTSLTLLLYSLTKFHFKKQELDKTQPQYEIYGLKGQIFAKESNNLLYDLYAIKSWKKPDSDILYFESVELNAYEKANLIAYNLQSENGFLNESNKNFFLGDNVKLVYYKENNLSDYMILTSSNVDVNNTTHLITSKESVFLTDGKSHISSIGFIYNQDLGELSLLSKVKVNIDEQTIRKMK